MLVANDYELAALAEALRDKTRICFDMETISFDDRLPAFDPWKGCRIAGMALALPDKQSWYISVRNREPDEKCVSVPAFVKFCQDLFCPTDAALADREVFGHNVKFDLRFLAADGVIPTCRVADTMVLARLVDNSIPTLTLENLSEHYQLGHKTGDTIKQYLAALKWTDEAGVEHKGSKDYGRVPTRIMGPYAEQDARLTVSLRKRLEHDLADFSKPLWTLEKRLTKILATTELDGVLVDLPTLKDDWLRVLMRLNEIHEKINAIAGWDVSLASEHDRTQLMVLQLGIKPKRFTPKSGRPQWTKEVLQDLDIPDTADPRAKEVADLMREFAYLSHFSGTYLEGWITRVDPANRLHADLRQPGAVTGRLSAGNPNTQNIPKAAERYVIAPPGFVMVMFDFSQVEYRIFAHYTADPLIKGAYLNSPDADFHQFLADQLGGIPRSLAKTLNFGFIYGMGRAKLIRSLADHAKDPEVGAKLTALAEARGMSIMQLAEAIYEEYHSRFPSIRAFSSRVGKVARERKYIKNLYGRRYDFDMRKRSTIKQKKAFGPHKAVNYLIQGSSADLLRRKLIELHDALRERFAARLFMTVHDSVYFYVPRDLAGAFYVEAKRILQNAPEISVPIFADGKVAVRNAAAFVEIDESGGRCATAEDVDRALVEAETTDEKCSAVAVGAVPEFASADGALAEDSV